MTEFAHRGAVLATSLMLRSESSIPAAAFAAGRFFHQGRFFYQGRFFHQAHWVAHV